MRRVAREAQIFGINFWIVSAAVGAATIAFSLLAGELLDFYPAIFEVVYPFFAAIVVGEWGKTRSDGNFDLIAAQCESLFPWVLRRYTPRSFYHPCARYWDSCASRNTLPPWFVGLCGWSFFSREAC